MKQFTFFLIFIPLLFNGCNIKQDEIPNDFRGNFYDKTGNDFWAFGIQDEFFVSDCQFWDYKKIKSEGNKLMLLLQNESIKKRIEIIKIDSISYDFIESNKTIHCSKKADSIKRIAKNNPFSMDTGMVTLKGYVKNFKEYKSTDSRIEFVFSNYIVRDTKSFFADIDSLGRFDINVKIMHASSFLMKYRTELTEIFVSPSDKLFISIDADNLEKFDFMGRHSDVCYDITKSNEALFAIEPVQQIESAYAKTPSEFRSYRKLIKQKQEAFLKDYLKNNNCSEVFNVWFTKNIQNEYFRELMSYTWKRFGKGSEKRMSPKDPYLSFIDSIDLNDSIAPITYNYFFFSMALMNKLDARDDINNRVLNLQKEKELKMKNPECSESVLNAELSRFFFNRKIDIIKSHEYSRFNDIRLTGALSEIIEFRQYDLIDYAFNRVKTEIRNKMHLKVITDYYNVFKKKEEEFKNAPISLMKATNKGELLLQEIIQKHKGKVLILDFWFTGCSACRRDFVSMKEIKKTLIGEDVDFVYLCYASTEKNWKNVLQEFNVQGEHYLLTSNQFSYFSEMFKINSAPRYILINKSGKITNSNFRPPMNPTQYLTELKNNLNR